MTDEERKHYRANGVFLFESRVKLVADLGACAVALTQVMAAVSDCDIDDDIESEVLAQAVRRLFDLQQRAKVCLRSQRQELFPIIES